MIDPFGFHVIASVLATPVAVVVTTVAQAPEAIALMPSAEVPLAMVCVKDASAEALIEALYVCEVESARI